MIQGVAVLGSTGSIGRSTLDVLARHPQRYRVAALAARRDVAGLLEQCRRFRPARVALTEACAADSLRAALCAEGMESIEVLCGEEALDALAGDPQVSTVVAAIVGAAGLPSALAAARAGKRILLANKEALVSAGEVFMRTVEAHGATLLPIDSEHNAIFQCLAERGGRSLEEAGVHELILTASGGPFRGKRPEELAGVSPEAACAHPNWSMGRKISVDSATLMNKGLEVIEAHWLFDAPASRLRVVVHPQSMIHSMVAFRDGSVLAELGRPDMRTPIAHALAWPERIDAGVAPLDFLSLGALTFEAPDTEAFPCLALAYDALERGGRAGAVLNAANEVAVEAFLQRRIAFTAIPVLIRALLNEMGDGPVHDLSCVLEADAETRARAWARLERGL